MGDGEVGFSKLNGAMQLFFVMLCIVGVIVPAVLGFVNLDKRQDILEDKTDTHIIKDEGRWEAAGVNIDNLREDIHLLELVDKELLIHYQEIIRRLDRADANDERIIAMLSKFEVSE